MRLSVKDFDIFQKLIVELYRHRRLDDFKEAVPHILRKAIPADYLTWHTTRVGVRAQIVGFEESERRATPQILHQWEEYIPQHPFVGYYTKTGDLSALRLSDFVSQSRTKDSPFVRNMLTSIDICYMLGVPTTLRGKTLSGLSFLREKRDFSERDRTLLNLLRPHVTQARLNAEHLSSLLASGAIRSAGERRQRVSELTTREAEVGQWLALGKTNPEIALLLNTSPRTVEKHIERILAKLGVENRTSAALMLC